MEVVIQELIFNEETGEFETSTVDVQQMTVGGDRKDGEEDGKALGNLE